MANSKIQGRNGKKIDIGIVNRALKYYTLFIRLQDLQNIIVNTIPTANLDHGNGSHYFVSQTKHTYNHKYQNHSKHYRNYDFIPRQIYNCKMIEVVILKTIFINFLQITRLTTLKIIVPQTMGPANQRKRKTIKIAKIVPPRMATTMLGHVFFISDNIFSLV